MSPGLLHKIAQLTLNKEEEALTSAFFPMMRSEYPQIQAIALYRVKGCEQTVRDPESLYGDDFTDYQADLSNLIGDLLSTNNPDSYRQKDYQDLTLLVKKLNREKQQLYFLAFLYEAKADDSTDSDSVFMQLLCLSEIYSNHREMISLNDKDALTGLYNRKAFDHRMTRLLNSAQHRRANDKYLEACFAIMDIDHFKKINDSFGHLYGDEVLLHFAQQMQQFFRQDDLLFRYGGEEFVVILKNIDKTSEKNVFERFRKHIESYYFPQVGTVTVSIGMTHLNSSLSQNEIVDRADHALYYIKEHGRNNIACYETLVEEGILKEINIESDIELF